MIRLVCGSGRCGSSLVMQMLAAGGIEVVGSGPYYEPLETVWHQFTAEWLAEQTGVVKLLHPIPCSVNFAPGEYRSIWMSRNVEEQAKSVLKFTMAEHKVPEADQDLGQIQTDLVMERVWSMRALSHIGKCIETRFETLVEHPKAVADLVCGFLQVDGDLDKMAEVVQNRPSTALPTMELEDKLIEEHDKKSGQGGR